MQISQVAVLWPFAQPFMDAISAAAPGARVQRFDVKAEDKFPPTAADCQVLYTQSVLPLPEQAPNLQWVQLHSAGVDHITQHPLFTSPQVKFTTASGVHAIPTAEFVLGQMLALARGTFQAARDQVAGRWPGLEERRKRYHYQGEELSGAVLGIIGYGSSCQAAARLATAVGMQVLAIKRDVRSSSQERFHQPGYSDPLVETPERIYPPEALHSFLVQCDYVLLAAPLTAQTRRMIDAEALAAMKRTAYLINVARGELIAEEALLAALQNKHIAGAALDVFSTEPLPPEHPLWKLDNVLLTPHISGLSSRYEQRIVHLFQTNLERFAAGQPLLNQVERERGY